MLSECRFTLPLQALTHVPLQDGSAYLMMLNPTGGVLGGDQLDTQIVQDAGTHVILTTPSATRIYRTSGQPAIQTTTIRLGEDSTLEYVPDHVVPHAGSALQQRLRLDMAPGSRAILLDALSAGRVAYGEAWQFREFDSRTEVFCNGKPLFLNRTVIRPSVHDSSGLGRMEGFAYLASIAVLGHDVHTAHDMHDVQDRDGWLRVAAAISEELSADSGISSITSVKSLNNINNVRGGVSLLSHGGLVVRYLAQGASDMVRMGRKIGAIARELVLRRDPFDHRKY